MNMPEDGARVLERREFTRWLGNGVHPISFLVFIGGRVASVTARVNREGFGVCVLEFENGVVGNFHLASGPPPIETYALFGHSWHLTIAGSTRVVLHRGIPFDYETTTTFAPEGDDSGSVVWEASSCLATLENKALFTQGIFNEMKYFCDCVLAGNSAELGSLEFALEVMEVCEVGLRSAGRTLPVHPT